MVLPCSCGHHNCALPHQRHQQPSSNGCLLSRISSFDQVDIAVRTQHTCVCLPPPDTPVITLKQDVPDQLKYLEEHLPNTIKQCLLRAALQTPMFVPPLARQQTSVLRSFCTCGCALWCKRLSVHFYNGVLQVSRHRL